MYYYYIFNTKNYNIYTFTDNFFKIVDIIKNLAIKYDTNISDFRYCYIKI